MGVLYDYTLEDMAASYLRDNELIVQRMQEINEKLKKERNALKAFRLRKRYNLLQEQSNELIRTAHYLQHYYDKD